MCIYDCTYVCVYIYMCICMYVYIYLFKCVYIYMFSMCIYTCRWLQTSLHMHIPLHTYTHECLCSCVSVCVCVSVSVSVHRSCVGRMASGQEVRQAYKGRLVQLETLRPSRCILNTKDPNRADLRNNARKPGAQGPTKSQACCTIQVTIRHLSGAKLRVLGLRFRD